MSKLLRVGSLVFSTDQGLGILAKSFYDHGLITDALVIRHGKHPEHDEWYPGSTRITDLRGQTGILRQFCAGMDIMLFLETPYDWTLIPFCQHLGIKTVLMPMYECTPVKLPAVPDLFLCPSLLDCSVFSKTPPHGRDTGGGQIIGLENYPSLDQSGLPKCVYRPIPVEVPWRQRTRAEVFCHNAGHGGLKGRNGTRELLEAWQLYVKSPARLILRTQGKEWPELTVGGPRPATIDQRVGTVPYGHLWDEGDVFIFPEKHNGLSLPLQEARAAGMLVMCGARFPMTTWLPNEPMIPVSHYTRDRIGPPYMPFDQANYDPKDIAAKIDEWYGRDISEYSLAGKAWAESMSWQVLLPKYREVLEGLVSQ